jgi:dipeptidyl aminopeptidase/acylaminoacyl peptidase
MKRSIFTAGAASLLLAGAASAAPLTLAVSPAPATPAEPMTTQGLMSIVEIGPTFSSSMSLSPDGRRFAVMAHLAQPGTNTYQAAWFVGETAGGKAPVNVGDGGDPELYKVVSGGWGNEAAQWSPESKAIYYRKKVNGAVQVWMNPLDGSPARAVTASPGDVTGYRLSLDGSTLYFTSDAPRAEIAAAQAAEYRAGYHADDKDFLLLYLRKPFHPTYYLQGGKPAYWAVDLASGATRLAAPEDQAAFMALQREATLLGDAHASGVRFGTGAFKATWLSVVNPEVNRGLTPPRQIVASTASDGAHPVVCADAACRGNGLENLGFDAAGEVVFVRYENGVRQLYAWRPGAARPRLVKTVQEVISDCRLTAREAICFLETPTWPNHLVSVDLASGTLKTLAEPNPDFGHWKLGQVKRLDWTSAHGVPTWGYLVYPADYQPGHRYPLVFVQYSPQECLRGGVGDEFPTHVFSAHGMMVLCTGGAHPHNPLDATDPDNRKEFVWDYVGFRRQVEVLSSYEEIIHKLDHDGLVDPKRVGITGLSSGAEAVLYALVHSKAFAAAGAAQIGIDEFSYFGYIHPGIDIMMKPIGWGDPYKPAENFGYKDISLSTNVDRIDTPLIVQTADREYLNAVPTFRRWRDAGKSMDLYVFDDEYHVKWQPAHRLNVYNRYVDWFDFWLNDRENDRAAKPEQYALWEGFRAKECAMPNAGEKAYCGASAPGR